MFIPFSWFKVGIIDVQEVNVAWLLVTVLAVSYLRFNILVALASAVLFFVVGILASIVSLYTPNWQGTWMALGALMVGAILLEIGPVIERRRLVFWQNKSTLWDAPAFWSAEMLFAVNLNTRLGEQVAQLRTTMNQQRDG